MTSETPPKPRSPDPNDQAHAPAKAQAKDPLHGLTLEAIVNALVAHFGFEELGRRVAIRCFQSDPSVASSLKFLRRTPWARAKVESLYGFMLREQARTARLTLRAAKREAQNLAGSAADDPAELEADAVATDGVATDAVATDAVAVEISTSNDNGNE